MRTLVSYVLLGGLIATSSTIALGFTTTALIGLLAGTSIAAYLIYDHYQDKATQRRRIAPTEQGLYPIDSKALSRDVAQQIALTLAGGAMTAAVERARAAHQVPHTYSPKIDMHHAAPQLSAALPAPISAQLEAPVLPTAPTFAQLVIEGFHARTDRMLLGYGVDGPIYGGIDALLSTAIAGRPSQGKSTTLRMIYAQCLQIGAEVMLLDPHGGIAGDVQTGPSQLVASTGAELDDAAAWLVGELEQRLVAYRAGERSFRPMLIMADEFPVISLSSKAAVQALGRIVLEARKVGGYALISGQGLPASNFGGRLVRDALSSRIIHKTTAAEGLRAGLDKNAAQLLEQLKPGYAILDGPTIPQIVAIPMTTADDLSKIMYVPAFQPEPAPSNVIAFDATRVTSVSTASERPAIDVSPVAETLQATGTNGPENAAQSVAAAMRETPQPLTADTVPEVERAQIVALAKAGISRRKIGEQVYGGIGGAAYSKVKQTLDAAGL